MLSAPPRAGFFHGFGVCTSVSCKDLSSSPEAHQNFEGSSPELCSGGHQKGCDLEGVEGATPPTPNHSFKTMTTFNTDYNNTELLDQELTIEQLEGVAGGRTIEELDRRGHEILAGWLFPSLPVVWSEVPK